MAYPDVYENNNGLTVGELRKWLEGIPDHFEVWIGSGWGTVNEATELWPAGGGGIIIDKNWRDPHERD